MRFSTLVAGLTATAYAVTASPPFLPVGNLPSQPTSARLVDEDMDAITGAAGDLSAAVRDAVNYKNGDLSKGADVLDVVMQKAIAYQGATQTARLNANGIRVAFNPADSAYIAGDLQNEIAPALKTASEVLVGAKKEGVLGVVKTFPGIDGSFLWPLGFESYLALVKEDTVSYLKTLLSFLDPSVGPDASAAADSINGYLNAIDSAYTAS
ncbi:hypothetical protein LZ30DRAFT_608677 [Colletotrichum cereale]|nr:hypothetical protein LZ30DRAFT_608677 [Colletotrichum cereale]